LKEINLSTAVKQIKQACEDDEQPFIFIVGAGISYPPVPLASHILLAMHKVS
jgi:hypothetical protein